MENLNQTILSTFFNANRINNTKRPFYTLNKFSGLVSENIDTFIKIYIIEQLPQMGGLIKRK